MADRTDKLFRNLLSCCRFDESTLLNFLLKITSIEIRIKSCDRKLLVGSELQGLSIGTRLQERLRHSMHSLWLSLEIISRITICWAIVDEMSYAVRAGRWERSTWKIASKADITLRWDLLGTSRVSIQVRSSGMT
jgi:hypothetical protein